MSGRKQPVSYSKPEEPSFLKKLKAQVGYREHKIEDKVRPQFEEDDTNQNDKEDFEAEKEEDKPQIVVLKPGDLSHDEVDAILKDKQEVEEEKLIDEGKITFKKPQKRPVDDKKDDKKCDESKRKKEDNDWSTDTTNSRLLSFDVDDDDDDQS